MRPLLLILLGTLTMSTAYANKAQRTTRKIPHNVATPSSTSTITDTDSCVITSSSEIGLSGYEKPLRSRNESIFVTNHSDHHITTLHLTLSYRDMQGRELHNRSISISCDIPSGATRLLTFPSWDRQQAFYYRLSSKPLRADGTPYDVHCYCDSANIVHN